MIYAAEHDAFFVQLGEADEEAGDGGDAELEEERGLEAVLLFDGALEAEVDLFVEEGAAGFDGCC